MLPLLVDLTATDFIVREDNNIYKTYLDTTITTIIMLSTKTIHNAMTSSNSSCACGTLRI